MKFSTTPSAPQKLKVYPHIHWHRRWIVMRSIKIGGPGTPSAKQTRMFILIGRIWARHSHLRGWLFSTINPIKSGKDGGQ
jgi:hypothetical protein